MKLQHEKQGGLWTFDQAAGMKPYVPSNDELREIWQEHHSSSETVELDMYGICETPTKQPTAILSLDLCEIVRETGPSLTTIYSADKTAFADDYGNYYGNTLLGDDAQLKRTLLLAELMSANYVKPVPYAEALHAFLENWGKQGVYVLANTSTLEGGEESTVKFLAEYYTAATKGILFPRNHDGLGSTTKAGILRHAKNKLQVATGFDFESIPTIAIEDAHHHATNYMAEDPNIQLFMPAYTWNEPLDNIDRITRVEQQLGTLDTFIAADEHIRSRGIVK